MKKRKEKKKRYAVCLLPNLYKKSKKNAEKKGISFSGLCAQGLKKEIKNKE